MTASFAAVIGKSAKELRAAIVASEVQLWGAALPLNTAADPCIFDGASRSGVCGDWLVEPSIQGAAISGAVLADKIAAHAAGRAAATSSFGIPCRFGPCPETEALGTFSTALAGKPWQAAAADRAPAAPAGAADTAGGPAVASVPGMGGGDNGGAVTGMPPAGGALLAELQGRLDALPRDSKNARKRLRRKIADLKSGQAGSGNGSGSDSRRQQQPQSGGRGGGQGGGRGQSGTGRGGRGKGGSSRTHGRSTGSATESTQGTNVATLRQPPPEPVYSDDDY